MISFVLNFARSAPAIPAYIAPHSIALMIIMRMTTGLGEPAKYRPAQAPPTAPMKYWPSPPMLMIPVRNVMAAQSPVNASGVAARMVPSSESPEANAESMMRQ